MAADKHLEGNSGYEFAGCNAGHCRGQNMHIAYYRLASRNLVEKGQSGPKWLDSSDPFKEGVAPPLAILLLPAFYSLGTRSTRDLSTVISQSGETG